MGWRLVTASLFDCLTVGKSLIGSDPLFSDRTDLRILIVAG
jgi:hypothetical protein